MIKFSKIITIFLVLLIISIFLYLFTSGKILNTDNKNEINKKTNNLISKIKKEEVVRTKLVFVGDIMMTRGVKSSVDRNFEGNYNKLFENLEGLKKADLLFGNLEGAVSDTGNNVGSKYSFRMEPVVLQSLKEAGFDILSFANNHIGDWNVTAFKDTLNRLNENNLLKTGAGLNKEEASNPTIIEKNNIKFGFLGMSDVGPDWMKATDTNPGILLASDPNLETIISNAKNKTDILIVSIHWGEEYKEIHNNRQEVFAHKMIDAGADIIIGHHPHVIQDIEWYKGKPIIYSLGNFIFDQKFSRETMRGMAFEINFENKEIKDTNILINILNSKYQSIGLYKESEVEDIEEVLYSSCPKPTKEYVNMFELNIGQDIGLIDTTYTPENLVELGNLSILPNICLIQEAKKSLSMMIDDAKNDNVNIRATSAYRSYSYQDNLLKNAIKNGNKNASIAIAKPGHSEHQLGTAVDLSGESIGYSSAISSFTNTIEDFWLRDNAYKYGFIQSYPSGKEDTTGYMYESWHYRYIGIDNAKKIKESNLTITEYLR